MDLSARKSLIGILVELKRLRLAEEILAMI